MSGPSRRLAFSLTLAVGATACVASSNDRRAVLAPAFPTAEARAWIGPPARWEELRGKVVLLDVWTFG